MAEISLIIIKRIQPQWKKIMHNILTTALYNWRCKSIPMLHPELEIFKKNEKEESKEPSWLTEESGTQHILRVPFYSSNLVKFVRVYKSENKSSISHHLIPYHLKSLMLNWLWCSEGNINRLHLQRPGIESEMTRGGRRHLAVAPCVC